MKKILLGSLLILWCGMVSAENAQNGDLEVWKKEYRERTTKRIEECLKKKPTFAEDVRFTNPDYVVFIPNVEPEKIGDTYNDHCLVFDKPDGKLFVVWTQATLEGAPDQHVAFSRSLDQGKTWTEPVVLAGSPTYDSGKPIASWAFPLVTQKGRIYLLYNQFIPPKVSLRRQHTGVMMGIFSDDDGVTWSQPEQIEMPRTTNDHEDRSIPAEWVVWQKPQRLAADEKYLVGMSRYANPKLHDKFVTATEFLRFENIDAHPAVKDIEITYYMNNQWILTHGSHCEEPALVKLPDGRLFSILRTASGSPFWTVSSDGGQNWSKPTPLLDRSGKPLPHPLSPCPLYDWKGPTAGSGYYFTFIHNVPVDPKKPYANRGPLYLLAGRFDPGAAQPITFGEPQLFVNRDFNQSFYTSTTMIDGKLVLWYPDQKFYLLGKVIDEKWFANAPEVKPFDPNRPTTWKTVPDPNLPNVLILGDSISIGYTLQTRKLLEGKANVFRPLNMTGYGPENCGDTIMGLRGLDRWLSMQPKWDVIHFNWGLWDLSYRYPHVKGKAGVNNKKLGQIAIPPEEYAANLEKIVQKLQATGAKLIWATTSLVPEGEGGRAVGDDARYNAAAAEVMKKYGIATDDIHALTKTFSPEMFEAPGNVHYSAAGSQRIAEQVAEHLEKALPKKK